jgi:hypothetical protein
MIEALSEQKIDFEQVHSKSLQSLITSLEQNLLRLSMVDH